MKLLSKFSKIFLLLLITTHTSYGAPDIPVLEQLLGQGSATSRIVQIFLLSTVLSLAPAIFIMATSFIRIIVVLSMLRNALGLQQSPPNQVLTSLALFLTLFIMAPAAEQAYHQGIRPLLEKHITEEQALPIIIAPFKKFMHANTRAKDLELFLSIAKIGVPTQDIEAIPIRALIPAFMISELRRAFEIGFLIFLPFLIIDIVVSSTLMAMGMMMMPPVMLSLPFKIIFFVLIDGWQLIVGSLVKSFST